MPAGRLLSSGTTWISNPTAVFVGTLLQEVLDGIDNYVAKDSADVVNAICSLNQGEEEELPFSKTYKDKVDQLKEMLSKTVTKALN